MCIHILFYVCAWGLGVGMGNFHPTPQRKKAREVYALRFMRTSSYATDSRERDREREREREKEKERFFIWH